MDLNATLIGQMITFAVLVIFTMKYVWPPITKALRERQQTIADGLAAAERGKHELELAHHKAAEQLRDAKLQAAKIVEQADKRAALIVEEAKEKARHEGERLLQVARTDIEQEKQRMKEDLMAQVAGIALSGAEKILGRKIDAAANGEMVDRLIAEVAGE